MIYLIDVLARQRATARLYEELQTIDLKKIKSGDKGIKNV